MKRKLMGESLITEGISGIVETARAVARMLTHFDITVIDSNGTAMCEYLIFDAAVRAMRKRSK